MNYELEISKSKPAVFNALNGGVSPLVAGSGSATKLTTTTNTPFTAFNKGYENIPFTLEVWFLPLTNTGEHVVIGHSTEGVLWDGSRFILRIKQGDGTLISEQIWRPSEIKAFHVAMVYSPGQAFLYVDGEVVASLALFNDSFFAVGQDIKINSGTTTGIYDSLALYYRSLDSREVKEHYKLGNSVTSAQQIAMLKGGTTWSLSYEDVLVAERFLYDSSNFAAGYTDNVMVTEKLVTSTDAVGTWRQSIVLSTLVGTTLPGLHLTYEGDGVTMSYSLDGATWTPVANKTTVLQDTAATDMFFIQLQLANDDSWVSYLRVDVLAGRSMVPVSGNRMLTFKSTAMDQTAGSQLDYQKDWGGQVYGNGWLRVETDGADTPQNVGTIEMWVKIPPTSGVYKTVFDNTGYIAISNQIHRGSIDALYVDGASRPGTTPTFDDNQWHHIVAVITTPVNNPIWIGRDSGGNNYTNPTVGHLAVYPYKMTAAQAQSLYARNVGAPALRVDDTSGITMTENTPVVEIYAYSWSYVSGGR